MFSNIHCHTLHTLCICTCTCMIMKNIFFRFVFAKSHRPATQGNFPVSIGDPFFWSSLIGQRFYIYLILFFLTQCKLNTVPKGWIVGSSYLIRIRKQVQAFLWIQIQTSFFNFLFGSGCSDLDGSGSVPDPHPQPSQSPKTPISMKYVTYISELLILINIIVNPDPAEVPFFI